MSKDLYTITIPSAKIDLDLVDFPVLLNLDSGSGTTNTNTTSLFTSITDTDNLELFSEKTYEVEVRNLEPVAYWRLGDTGSTAVDEMGLADGTYVGSPTLGTAGLLADDVDTCAHFDTTGQYANVGENIEINADTQISISCLIKLDSIGEYQSIFVRTEATNHGFILEILPTGKLRIFVRHTSTTNELNINGDTVLSAGTLYHIVFVIDDASTTGNRDIYINGQLDTIEVITNTLTSNPTYAGSDAYIGNRVSTQIYPLDGLLDELAIFDKALTADEVTNLYNTSLGTFGKSKSLSIEVDRWDDVNESAQLWAKIPFIAKDVDTKLTLVQRLPDSHSTLIDSFTPLAYWRLGETIGTGTATDETGTYDGTYQNTPTLETTGLLTNDLDTAVTFDGIDQHVSTALVIPAVTTMSASALITPTNIGVSQTIFGDSDNTGHPLSMRVTLAIRDTGNWGIGLGNNSSYWFYDTISHGLLQDTTYHVCLTINGTSVILYLDGVEVINTTSTVSLGTIGSNLFSIGRFGELVTNHHFEGVIDEVALFTQELTPDEVSQIYNSTINIAHPNPNIGVTGTVPAQDVWSEYDAVYHLSLDGADSSANSLDGSLVNMDGTNVVDFGIGKGLEFNGTDEHIALGFQSVFNMDFSTEKYIHIEQYMNSTNNGNTQRSLQNRGRGSGGAEAGFQISWVTTPNWGNVLIDSGSTNYNGLGTVYPMVFGVDRQDTFTMEADTAVMKAYLAGVLGESGTNNTPQDVISNNPTYDQNTTIGCADTDGVFSHYFAGKLKEVRFSKVEKSTGWISSNYESTQDTLVSFLAFDKHISGSITEAFTMSEWLVRSWLASTGVLTDEQIVTGASFTLDIDAAAAGPQIVTVSPNIGNMWVAETVYVADDLVHPLDPSTDPYYFKCVTGGTSDTTEPTWPTISGNQVVDGTVTWENVEGLIQPITQYPLIPV